MANKKGKRRINTYFRQTAKAFRAARQTQVFSHIKRNIPYTIVKSVRRIKSKTMQAKDVVKQKTKINPSGIFKKYSKRAKSKR